MATLFFYIPTRLAVVGIADVSISVQEIVDQFRDFEDRPEMMVLPRMLAAEGKGALPDGSSQVITASLLNGWRIQFADRAGPSIIECNVFGGNLLAYVDDVGSSTQTPIAPSTFVFPSYAAATTGALLGTVAPEYLGAVWIDVDNGESGTGFPVGTPLRPVNNTTDAITISTSIGLLSFNLLTDATFTGDISHHTIKSEQARHTAVLGAGVSTVNTAFRELDIEGNFSGGPFLTENCRIANGVGGLHGTFRTSSIDGLVTLAGDCEFFDCIGAVAGAGTSIVDVNSIAGIELQFRSWVGGLELRNCVNGGTNISVDMMPGRLVLPASNTGGILKVRGIGEPIDNTGATFTLIDSDGYLDVVDVARARKWLTNREELDDVTGARRIYDDDGVTVLENQTITDKDGNVISIDTGAPARRSAPT